MTVAARASVDRGCRNLTLEVRVSNTARRTLYRRFGFVPAGMRRGYYPENGEDALVMWATDVDGAAYARRLADDRGRVPASP
jgi:ribosomal-protein-alanine N-acetyltransferase